MHTSGHRWSSAELQTRVANIIADVSARKQKADNWRATTMPDKTTSEAEWKEHLDAMEYKVLREKGTSPRGGEYDAFYPEPNEGYFACRGCGKSSSRPRHRARAVSTALNTELHLSPTSCGAGQPLYSAAAKFKSGCGWPAFDKCFKDAVEITTDESHGMQRIEITCARWVPLHANRAKALANAPS